ncbi:MAG: HD domain-containing phosphohydrolase [Betaproteobacteria bacterium]
MPTTTQTAESAGRLREASRLIDDALKKGTCSDPRLLELSALDLANIRVDVPEQLRIMLAAARFFYVTGHAFRAIPIAQMARSLGLEAALPEQTIDALIAIGICSADSAGLPSAMEAYADALVLAQGLKDETREAKIWQNLGAALVYSGLHSEALNCFRESLKFSDSNPALKGLSAGTYTNIALCHLHLDEIRQGLAAIQRSIDLSGEPADPFSALNRVLAENYFARLLLEVNNFDAAKLHSRLARKYAADSNTPRADISASVAEGLTEVFSGQVDVGISRLTNTLERARTLKVTSREALVALVKAFEFIGQPDRALIYLRQMLEQQRDSQEQNALKHVKLHLQQLHPGIEDESSAIRRLQTREEVLEGRIAKQELTRQSQELFKARVEVMERLAVAAELRDDSTGEHSYRVGRMASLLAKEFGCDDDTVFMIDIAARLHDIGKIGIPDGILLKPAPLNAAERDVMKSHTTIGAEVLAKSNIAHMQMAEEIARHHHEWWDGTGYPGSQSSSGIPLAARITALADVFDALTHARPYKSAWTLDSALTEILSLRGRQFDPELTDLFLGLVARLRREHDNLDLFLGAAAKESPFLQARDRIRLTLEKDPDDGAQSSISRLDMQR